MRRPPAAARWLLRLCLPPGPVGRSIAADLEQEYRRRPAPARLWYVRQAAGVAWHAIRDRLRGRGWGRSAGAGWGRPSGSDQGRPSGSDLARPSRVDQGRPSGVNQRPPAADPGPGRRSLPGATLLADLRFAARMMARRPLLTAVAVLTLAVGIGMNTAIFSVASGLLWRPVPGVADPSTIVEIYRGEEGAVTDVGYPELEALRAGAATLDDLAGFDPRTLAYRDAGNTDAVVLAAFEVTGNYFSVLGVEPAAGRFFAAGQSLRADVADEVVISHDLWRRRYGGRADVLGRRVAINGHPAVVVGVAPEGFGGHQVLVQRDVFVPVGMPAPGLLDAADLEVAGGGPLVLLGRLADGVGLDAARQEIGALGRSFATDRGLVDLPAVHVARYDPLWGTDRAATTLLFGMLQLIVLLVLVVACVNVAGTLLARASERHREIAVRAALGASRGRLARQLLTESTLLFLVAGAAGLLLSAVTTSALVRLYLPDLTRVRLHLDVSPDLRVAGFAMGIATVAGLVFGLAPALAATRTIRAAGPRGGGGPASGSRLRALLVAGQMALALVLLVAAGLLVRTVTSLESADPGFDVDGVYAVELDLALAGHGPERARLFYRELLDGARAIPGVEGAATAALLPLAEPLRLDGVRAADAPGPPAAGGDDGSGLVVHVNRVSDGYFRTVGIPLLEGRGPGEGPARGAQPAAGAVVNTTLARRLWGDGSASALGRRFTAGSGAGARSYEVVGVAADARYHGLAEETPAFVYLAAAGSPDPDAHLLLRGDLEATLGPVRALLSRLDPDVPVVQVLPMEDLVAVYSIVQRLAAWVAGVVGLLGLLLGAVGVYGVTAFAVARRSHEIGVRLALGARGGDVAGLVVRGGMRAPLAGMAVGLLLAAAAARLLGSLLHEVSPADPATWIAVTALLAAVALAATAVPARRAAALDPVDTLRSD